MREKRGTAGQRAHALPTQEPGQASLAARMLHAAKRASAHGDAVVIRGEERID